MKVIKIVLGILLILASLGNFLQIGGMRSAELMGYVAATMLFLFIGIFLLYSGLKPKPPSISISGEE